eukprot:gb/GFBE01009201.1/.p1 GENE.gb/GFBE01009201.1/~~gb/GFBE01009201.1/.p1  ORF type:complete len:259 (+),score=25.81 gb/GFBE01009201.1/:1-777(+)
MAVTVAVAAPVPDSGRGPSLIRLALPVPELPCFGVCGRKSNFALSIVAAAALVIGRQPRARQPRAHLAALSLLQRMLGDTRSEAERIDDEIAELKQQEVEDLKQLQHELGTRGPSEEDVRVEALRRQQEKLARIMGLRRARRQSPCPASLHAPWRSYLDVGSGRWYYYNEETGVSTWDLPTLLMPERPPEPPAPWSLVAHDASGKWYYHNLTTGATSWDCPTPPVRRRRPSAQRRAAPRSQRRRRQASKSVSASQDLA